MGGKRVTMRYFCGLLSKIRTKLSGWNCELLPLAAWKVLLQFVLTVILRFMLSNR